MPGQAQQAWARQSFCVKEENMNHVLEKTVIAPSWEASPVAWACWTLENHPHIYERFESIALGALVEKPDRKLSANQIMHVIRWETSLTAEGDTFKINDHAAPLYARMFVQKHKRYEGCFRNRKSIFDMLTEEEERQINQAFKDGQRGIRG
jgi:hypothetical protein